MSEYQSQRGSNWQRTGRQGCDLWTCLHAPRTGPQQCREFSDKRSQDDTSFPDLDLFDNTEWLHGAGILDQPERYDDPPTLQYFPNDGGEVMEHGHHLQINAEEPLSEKRLRSGSFFVDP
ncbi:hypothetical protein FOXG_21220 [Fusarium oxysporum f. sp. lycopersici 4287]|uniref:Uncharacterized protein n=1 Tax=Fusarium oxysporum f. sp. lycopersici (strain 4287 / CBS 123668 / FGSC 9935 / NRRL 34936) TaxID=426428 RepID=A0A0J9VVV9_FUSO4|nr:hypothetical protein FOXG_21220 [Fusarium oxysporum f. sp. lycopersici 4287]KNB14866.1 hypothetical protein FOXG_21220 [Fusarium oxysporum f. sp. lycopersici 4287]